MAAHSSSPTVHGSDVHWHYRSACEIRLHYPVRPSSHRSAIAESVLVCVLLLNGDTCQEAIKCKTPQADFDCSVLFFVLVLPEIIKTRKSSPIAASNLFDDLTDL